MNTRSVEFFKEPETAARIAHLRTGDLISVRLFEWRFLSGAWEDGEREEPDPSAVPLPDPANGIDIDEATGTPHAPLSEGAAYAVFESEKEGFGLLGIACDWWFEACCNGKLCATTFPPAAGHAEEEMDPEFHPFLIPVQKGKNRLTVHLRRGNASWRFVCRNVHTLPPIAMLRETPWLLWPSAGRITVCFRTFGAVGAGVRLHPEDGSGDILVWDSRCGRILRREFHRIPLQDLKPGMTYTGTVLLIDPENPEIRKEADGGIFPITVPDAERRKYSFFFTADLQFPKEERCAALTDLLRAADAATCDFIVFGGDIGSDFSSRRMIEEMIPLLPPGKPLVNVRGNHELRGSESDAYPEFFSTPEGRTYDMFRIGDTAFLALDCGEDKPAETPGSLYVKYNLDFDFLKEETEYLYEAVRKKEWTTARRHIVFAHGAPYSHCDSCLYIPFLLQRMTDPLFGGRDPVHKIDLWLAGHVHNILRSIPGTDELAAMCPPKVPLKGGKDYRYPVLTVSGPGKSPEYHATAFRVDAEEKFLRVRCFAPDGTCLEDLVYRDDGSCEENVSLPHFSVPAVPDAYERLKTNQLPGSDVRSECNFHSIERYGSWLKTFLSSSRETR